MIFWSSILTGVIFVYMGIKKGFYETWMILFNGVVSIYLGIFLRPIVADFVPANCDSPYNNALIILLTAFGAFVILHGLSVILFGMQFRVSLSKILDIIGAGFLGFWIGILMWSFVCFLISVTPLPQNQFVKATGFADEFKASSISNLEWWMNRVNGLVSSKSNFLSTDNAISGLVKSVDEKYSNQNKPLPASDPNKVAEPNVAPRSYPKKPVVPINSACDANKIKPVDSNSHKIKSGSH